MPAPTLIFDLDGTLTDPREGIIGCLRHALHEIGAEIPSSAALEQCIGPPLREALESLLGDDATAGRALAVFREQYGRTGLFENALYPGLEPALEELAQTSPAMFIATSKPQEFADRIADHFGLRRFFRAIYGCGMNGELSDKADLIRHLMACENVTDAVMIGDRRHDIIAAHANGIRGVGVTWGFGSLDELREAGADAICTSFAALAGWYFSACIIPAGL